ncbi:MAG: prolyl oligopeptidase family serine peptidase [Bacteroidota bacterium]
MKGLYFTLFFIGMLIEPGFTQPALFTYETYVNADSDSLPYRMLISDYDTMSTYPLVIFLHGSGESGTDNESQLKWGVMNFATSEVMANHHPIVIAPQKRQDERWDNFSAEDMTMQSKPSRAMALLRELIDELVEKFPVDRNRIYITGLSMGGFGAYDAISRYPDLFAAAVPVCGGGDTNQVEKFKHVPMWIFHGAQDDVVKPSFSLDMLNALHEIGKTPGFTLLPETGHFAWISAYSNQEMINWLFRQSK